jgi:predicted CxxxxCH...CXXCH cytochrome family protein
MNKKVIIKALVLALALNLISTQAYTLDYPHSGANNIICDACHFIYGTEPSLLPEWTAHIPQDIDDTQFNMLCWSCHNDIEAPHMRTHSSLEIDSGYGNWSVECRVCHNPHYQKQFRTYGSESYLYQGIVSNVTTATLTESGAGWTPDEHVGLILVPNAAKVSYNYQITGNTSDTLTVKGTIDTARVSAGNTFAIVYGKLVKSMIILDDITITPPQSGNKTVKFFNSTGTNSFADGDGTYDGVCEACHTQTLFHRNDATGDHNHTPGIRCTSCHQHIEGFKGSGCDVCHGFPPTVDQAIGGPDGLVNNPDVTGSVSAGVHAKHVNVKNYACIVCHVDSAGSGPTHMSNMTVTIGFSLFGGSYLGGMYDGQLGVNYDSSETNTTVLNTGSMTCDSLYCHSNADPFDGLNEYKTPAWDGSVTCLSCHDEGGSASGLSGRHPKHTDGSAHAFHCEKCHSATATDSDTIKSQAHHVNNSKDIVFSAGGSYDSGVRSCTSTYCHSDAVGGPPNINVEWDVANTMECYSCHSGRPDDDNTANCASIGGTWDAVSGSCTFADQPACESNGGEWDEDNGCYTILTMNTNGHKRLVSKKWIREYKCYYCHDDTTNMSNNIDDYSKHVNENKDVVFPSQWHLFSGPAPSYDPDTKVCDNLYCHSDGTTVNPEVKPYPWDGEPKGCNACHGHSGDCTECHTDITGWPAGQEWRSSMPMYTNSGPGTPKSNTHTRHILTDFTCNQCHASTILGGSCTSAGCHEDGIPPGNMLEYGHVDPNYHVNKLKDVHFQEGGTYDSRPNYKKCSNTACHTGADPQWGDSVNSLILCYECHGSTSGDEDDFAVFNDTQAKIDMNEWADTGHGRSAASGNYPYSGNPPADFPGNPCWYCHDNTVLHNDETNPLRLQMHEQYEKRFEKECVYCHMEGLDSECLSCHNTTDSTLAPHLDDVTISNGYSEDHDTWNISGEINGYTTCLDVACHGGSPPDPHNTDAGLWKDYEKTDVKNQYMMMGVCLKCHDDDSNGKCTECHTAPPEDPDKYSTGFDPGMGLITAVSKATSTHFGYKHFAAYETSFGVQADSGTVSENAATTGELKDSSKSWTVDEWAGDYVMMTSGANVDEYRKILRNMSNILIMAEDFTNPVQEGDTYYINDPVWKGGKFCWDCHDPHGDTNIYMIQDEIATETDGTFGIPVPGSRRAVTFTQKATGLDYVRTSGPDYDGICNVCHTDPGMHYRFDYGDGHQSGRVCTTCHEHRFSDSHSSGKSCTECHGAKPVPRHTGFSQPRDCTKCHAGIINKRVDIVTQLSATNSHHIQGVEVTNRHCYACHWEATEDGLINIEHHQGYNYETHITTKNAAADLVIWGPGERPTTYEIGVTATTFLATNIGTGDERTEVAKVTSHCLGCHSEQNNDIQPFNIVEPLQGDCKTPNQYAWDGTSIGERYSQTETTSWGKYETVPDASQRNITKAFSAHGNAVNNEGGWDDVTGVDGTIPNTRAGDQNVQCFDCHSSHGSRTEGITSSYVTFNGTNNGANLKETQAGKEGYQYTYKARANPDPNAINPYNAGAAQCFDCHQTENAQTELYPGNYSPWGYADTFGADAGIGIMGYRDTSYFGQGVKAVTARFDYRASRATIVGGHLHASRPVKDSGTATGGSSTTIDDAGKSWATGEWIGYFALMKSGDNTGEMRKITANTATQLTVYAFDNPVGGDDYEIVQPLVKETGTASGGSTTTIVDGTKNWDDTDGGEWAGYFVLMQSGSNSGRIARITANTTTQLNVGGFANYVVNGDTYEIVPYAKTINGLCTPCHDPHGVSPTLGNDQRYAVPLLKGTWLTSPFKEDHPPDDPTGNCATSRYGETFKVSWGRTRCGPSGSAIEAATHYQIDRNTFDGSGNRITEDDQKFAGLCLRCHPKENLTDGTNKNTDFRTKDRIHESVKGWGENTEHSYPCSKCHQPHVSGLPRLMQTNCLDYNHRGYRESGGIASSSHQWGGQGHGRYWGYPIANVMGNSSSYRAQNMCHTQATPNPDVWPDSNRWNNVTPW